MAAKNLITPKHLDIDTTSINREEALTLADVRHQRLIEGRLAHGVINPQTLQRYACHGKPAADGSVVLLPTYFDPIKRLYLTTQEWVARWLQELDKRGQTLPKPTRRQTPRQAKKAHERSAARMRKRGFTVPTG